MNEQNFQQNDNLNQNRNFVQPHRATTVLVLGILGLVCCGILGVIAWIFGNEDIRKMNSGQMDMSGYDTTKIGRLLGIISTVLWIVGIAIYSMVGGLAALFSL